MDRRSFIFRAAGATVLAGTSSAFGKLNLFEGKIWEGAPTDAYDLVAIKGGEADVMFAKGIEALGGMKMFVKKGQKVVVKPNIGWDVSPERGGDTNPKLISEITKQCLSAGAKEVIVFDNTCDNWQRAYKNSGISTAVTDAGGKIAPGNTEGYFHDVAIPGSKNLSKAKVHRADSRIGRVHQCSRLEESRFGKAHNVNEKFDGNCLGPACVACQRPPPVHRRFRRLQKTGPEHP